MAETFSNLVELCERSCRDFGDRPLFGVETASGWHWITYAEFKERVDRFRAALARYGIGEGDRVAIVSNNRVEWAAAAYATYGRKGIFVAMYEAQQPEEWQFILQDCGAKLAIGSSNAIYRKLKALQNELPALEHIVGLDLPDSQEDAFAAWMQRGAEQPVDALEPDSDTVACYLYTSGTTGQPKGVILTHGNITSNINAVHALFEFSCDDRSLSFVPWAHALGQTCELHTLLSLGASIGLNDDVSKLVEQLPAVKPTVLVSVPRIFNRIYDGLNKQMKQRPAFVRTLLDSGVRIATHRNRDESIGMIDEAVLKLADKLIFSKVRERFGGRLRYAVSGGAALSLEVAEFIDALGITVYEGYGLTETSPIAATNAPGQRRIGSVGKPIPRVEIVIDTSVSDEPERGEVVIYGPNVMQGYFNRPEETAQMLGEDGGLRSGDMGYFDEGGFLHITGRIKEQYKLENGKYVTPAVLEEELKLSPYISNAMLHGANRPYNVALIALDEANLKSWAQQHGVELSRAADDERVRRLIQGEIEHYANGFKRYEKPRDFVITQEEELSAENDMLTPTLKLKRRKVLEKYGDALEALYEKGA